MIKLIQITAVAILLSCGCANAKNRHLPLAYLNVDGIHASASGTVYAAEGFAGSRIFTIDAEGVTRDLALGFDGPIDITNDSDGNLYVTNYNNATVSKVSTSGEISHFADVLERPSGITIDVENNLYVSHYGPSDNGGGDTVLKITPDGEVSVFSQGGLLDTPIGTTIDPDGNVYVANFNNGIIVKITPDGVQEFYAQVESELGFVVGHLAYVRGRLFATGSAEQKIFVIRRNGRINVRDIVPEAEFPNGITYNSATNEVLFINAYAPASTLRRIRLRTPNQN